MQGSPVEPFDDGELVLDTNNRDDGSPLALPALPLTEAATEEAPGAIDGSFDVSDRGTAGYLLPIVAPPGRNGIEPSLSLKYDGGQANGAVGVGWSIGGLSSIARCPKIVATDGWAEPVRYDDSDPVCLDGQRLVVVSGRPWASGTVFRAELDGLDKVTLRQDGADGELYFEVRKRDGRIYRYGYDSGSRVYRDQRNQVVRIWALSRIEDRLGNFAKFEYGKFESAEARQLNDTYGEPIVDVENQTVEIFLRSVAYGGIRNELIDLPSRRLIELEYDPVRFDYMDGSTRGGARVARTQLLRKVTTSVGGSKVRSYELAYQGVQVPGPLGSVIADDFRTRRLKQVTECGHKHGSRVCKRPTVFEYTDQYGLEPSPHVTPFPQLKPERPRSLIKLDWNGDGRDDILIQKSAVLGKPSPESRWTLLVATGDRVGPAFVEATLENLSGPYAEAPGCINQNSVLDYNHDGKDDVVSFCGAERLHKKWYSTGDIASPFRPIDGWETPLGAPARMLLVDLDADGFMDLFTCADDNVVRSRHNVDGKLEAGYIGVIEPANRWGTCFDFSKQVPDDPLMVQDIDGDGYGEVLMYRKPAQAGPSGSLVDQSLWARYVVTEEGTGHWQPMWLPLTESAYSDGAYRFVDLNGDGLKDLVYLDIAASKTPLLAMNHGGVFGASRPAYSSWDTFPEVRSALGATIYSLRSALPVDFDGDGAQDLLRRFDSQAASAPLSATPLWQWDRAVHQLDEYAELWGDDTLSPPVAPFRLTPQPGVVPPQRGREVPALLADVDADASPDLVQVDHSGSLNVSYGFFGRECLLKTVTDGLGKRIEVRYDAVRQGANGAPERVYQPAAVCHNIEQSPRTRCIRNPGPLVSEYSVAYDVGGGAYRVDTKARLRYEDAREGLWGRGFYGFGKRVVVESTGDDALIRSTEVKREVFPRQFVGGRLAPFAGRELERTVVTAPAQSSIEAQPALGRIKRVNVWRHRTSALGGPLAFVERSTEQVDEILPAGPAPVTETLTINVVDELGNLESSSRDVRIAGNIVSTQASVTAFDKSPQRLDAWLVTVPLRRSVSDRVHDFRSEDPFVERTVGFQHDDLGLVTQVTREPDADRSSGLQQVTDYTRSSSDPYRRIQAITRSGTWVDDGDEVTQSRRTTLEYDDDVIFLKRARSSVRCAPDGSACSELVTDVRFDPRDGTLLGVVDPAGVGTLVGYDSFGRVLKEVRASGTTTVDYQEAQSLYSNGRLVPAKLKVSTKNSATGATSTVRLDSLGRTVQTSRSGFRQESLLQEFEFAWGSLLSYASRPHLPSDATQGAVTQDYDARWRLIRRSFPDGTSVQLGSASVDNTSVASEGREVRISSVRDQRGNTSYAFTDFRGNTLRKVDELGTATRYLYNPFSTLALIVDFQSNETRLRVDVLGRLVEHDDADTGLQAYRYTAFDQTLSMTDGDGAATRERRYRYDELGRLVTVQAPEGPTSFAYDEPGANAEGKLVEATSPSGATEHYEYEPRPADGDPMKNRGFVEQVSRHIDGTTYTTHFGYDPARNLLDRIDYPESGAGQPFSVRYSYDAFGNLESVKGTSEDGLSDDAALWTLDAAYQGQAIAGETFGNGVTTAYSYEASTGRLKRLTTRDTTDVILQDINYTAYDGNGNLKARTTTLKRIAAAGTETINELFNYDALDRLDDYSANGAVTDLRYDELGNIQFKTGVGSYDYVEDGKAYRPLDQLLPRSKGTAFYAAQSTSQKISNFEKLAEYTQAFDEANGTQLWEAIKATVSSLEQSR